jgi:hypothetical protein
MRLFLSLSYKALLSGVWCGLLLVGCGLGPGAQDPIVPSLGHLEEQVFPSEEEPGRYRLEVSQGSLVDLEQRASRLPAGEVTFNVVNQVAGARSDVDGLDLANGAIALWLRGRGESRHWLPQFSVGPVNSGVQEDWSVLLPAGDYVLSVTLGGQSDAVVLVR